MTPSTHAAGALERRYRSLLLAYPADYRASKGDEIVATLLDCARPRQTVPSLRDLTDVLGHAARRRFSTAEFELGARAAAPWALAVAAGIAAFAWWRIEPVIATTGPLAYAVWIAAVLGWVFLPAAAARPLIGVAVAATIAAALAAVAVPLERPPLWIVMSLTALGCIAFAGNATATAESRLNVLAATVAVVAACGLVSPTAPGYYQPMIARIGIVVAAGVLATAVVAFQRRRQGKSARLPVIAGLLLALPATWLGPIDAVAWHLPLDDLTAARFGRLAHVILATCAVLCVIAWFGHRGRPFAPRRLAAVALGSAAGYAAFASFTQWPTHAIASAAVLIAVALLLRARPAVPTMLAWSAAMLTACWLVGVYSNNWSTTEWASPAKTVVLASMLTIAPCSLVAFAALRTRALLLPGVVAAGWIGYLALPALIAWGPLLWALAAMVLIAGARGLRSVVIPSYTSAHEDRDLHSR